MKPIETLSYLDPEGNLPKGYKHEISDETLIRMYQVMQFTKRLDERMITLQRQGQVNFAMSSRGEEGCIVASAAALEQCDWIYPQYREQASIFWRGMSAQDYLHHMFLNEKDDSKGRQMANHFGRRELNVMTVSSTLATQIPHAAGCAYAMKISGKKEVALCYFGEGAASEGDFHGALNFGAVRKVPAIFFCRNNKWAISTPIEAQYSGDGIAPRAPGYGIDFFRVDGNDVFAVYEATKKAREMCLNNEGPILIEAMTYRLGAHSTADDPTKYRPEGELTEWSPKGPIVRLGNYLKKKKLWSEKKDKEFLESAYEEIEEAIKIARDTPKPGIESMFQDIYSDIPWNLREQRDFLNQFREEEGH
ncbi:thiamine pyrophosphate-dependent dehydrogenase E1 component subunit alpha [bacterium]|nr:thiamine pyrophosphate-dependent dehydrogenase E1 component subunit alpha [bacterium]